MNNKVFLGGTCNNSTWRDELIPQLKIDYFNPVVETKRYMAKEATLNLESIYLSKIDNLDVDSLELSKEAQKIREIMQDWTGED